MALRAFVFTIEAFITFLLAISLFSTIQYLSLPTYSDVYLLQLSNDLHQIFAKKYFSEISQFSKGDSASKKFLQSQFSKIQKQLGNYCMVMHAKSNRIEINCPKDKTYSQNFASDRLFYDGDFFNLKIEMMV
ncbi:hypothetical protein HY989_04020 [Candidatus Micrarchaeota archaeon]|nr:hypothetical protein [Candidatus Micrarchaeota archaeon]